MKFAMHIQDADLAEALREYIGRRLRLALSRFGGQVGEVTIGIAAQGRGRHRCRISAEAKPFGRVAAEETGCDLFAAVERATGRIGRLFAREVRRVRDARTSRDSVRLAA